MSFDWKDINEEFPEYDEFVIWCFEDLHYELWEIDKDMDFWDWYDKREIKPTHWCRIQPPTTIL